MPLLFSLAAYAADTRWQEEIVTAEGTHIVLKRSESRSFFASSSLPGSGAPEKHTLSTSIPGLGEVTWEHDYRASPLAFDVVAGAAWVVLDNDIPCEKFPTDESLRIFRYAGHAWTQVRMADAPPGLEANLLSYPYAESHGNLGRRRYLGKCDEGLRGVDRSFFDTPAGTWLRRPPFCGEKLEKLARAVLRGGRNCALEQPPRHPSFQTKWRAYRQAAVQEVTARTVNTALPAPALASLIPGIQYTRLSAGPMRFRCVRGCTADVLDDVIEYKMQGNSSGLLEFAPVGAGERRFYAQLLAHPSLLVCDRQGFKMLHMDRDSSGTPRVRAEAFDLQGELAGKWSVALPDLQAGPTYLYAFDIAQSELRVLVGRGEGGMCQAATPQSVIELRAPR